ncbi:hypothetical protein THF1D04_50100 [Vibrio owensii]|uniref:GNAT family N-acetyltransferase n=1 Tax=Vibrio owensii TaxID=696485 RepID=A0AAU9QB58_9VIBR|nr:hypothetical protein THF1D04_50100 [Vibrio owensii]
MCLRKIACNYPIDSHFLFHLIGKSDVSEFALIGFIEDEVRFAIENTDDDFGWSVWLRSKETGKYAGFFYI